MSDEDYDKVRQGVLSRAASRASFSDEASESEITDVMMQTAYDGGDENLRMQETALIKKNGWQGEQGSLDIKSVADDSSVYPYVQPKLLPDGASNISGADVTLPDGTHVAGYGYDLNGSRLYGVMSPAADDPPPPVVDENGDYPTVVTTGTRLTPEEKMVRAAENEMQQSVDAMMQQTANVTLLQALQDSQSLQTANETLQRALQISQSLTNNLPVIQIADKSKASPLQPSGVEWVNRFPTSRSLNNLNPSFKRKVNNFINAISNAGGQVRIAATYRPPERAYLMHYSSAIARGDIAPENVPRMNGVPIQWVHSTPTESIQAAQQMADAFGIVYPPALVSRHTAGNALDMNIIGLQGRSVLDANGASILIQNRRDLYSVGASYGVRKLISDPPHWSDNGH